MPPRPQAVDALKAQRKLIGPLVVLLAGLLLTSCSNSSPSHGLQERQGKQGAVGATTPATSRPQSSATAAPSQDTGAPSAVRPCGIDPSGPVPVYRHVVWILMENRSYEEVASSTQAPFLERLAAVCGTATDYYAVAHPSLPNYVALTSGSTQGITDDAGPYVHPLGSPSIFALLGPNWRTYAEAMPYPCDPHSQGEYAVRHNPAVYYTGIHASCESQDLPLHGIPNLSAAFTVIVPDLCHDMHDCSTSRGDAWLASFVPGLLDSPQYRGGSTVIFITWDESDAGPNRVALFVIAPSVPRGERSPIRFSHYSLLRSTEELLGIHPLLAEAAGARGLSAAFHL